MLEKIEAAYLAVMRVVVLIAATLALIVCIAGAAFAAPVVLRQLGLISDQKQVEEVDLATFIEAQKGRPEDVAGASQAPPVVIPAKIAKASGLLADYIEAHSDIAIERPRLEELLNEKRLSLEATSQDAYEDSLLALATQLKASTGRPLSFNRVVQLLDWHMTEFQANVAARQAADLARAAKASSGMAMAGAGLVGFVLILFFFLFVKIERNLRLVRTHEVPNP